MQREVRNHAPDKTEIEKCAALHLCLVHQFPLAILGRLAFFSHAKTLQGIREKRAMSRDLIRAFTSLMNRVR
jgi:hypothetical protein